MIIALDFDGTLVEHRYPRIGVPLPGAFQWVKQWQAAGAKVILWTMRSDGPDGPTLKEAVDFCRSHGVTFFAVNENPSQRSWTTSPKALATLYVDDSAFGCPKKNGAVDWEIVGPAVLDMIDFRRERGIL